MVDFPRLFYKAIAKGVLLLKEGTKRICALQLEGMAKAMNCSHTNRFGPEGVYHIQIKKIWAAMRAAGSGKAACAIAAGPLGMDTGNTAPPINADLPVNFYGVPPDVTLKKTLRDINPYGDDKACGLFPGVIREMCQFGGHFVVKVDETDIKEQLGVTRQLVLYGDHDFTEIDPQSPDPKPLQEKLLSICAAPQKFLQGDQTADLRPSVRAAKKFVAESVPKFDEVVADAEAEYARKQEKYRARRLKTGRRLVAGREVDLHHQQWTNLVKITTKVELAKTAKALVSAFLVDADGFLQMDESDDEAWVKSWTKISMSLIDVMKVSVRVRRTAAKKLLAVFLHSANHASFRCIGRFFVENGLDDGELRKLYDKVKTIVRTVEVDDDASPPVLLGVGADGAYTSMLNGSGETITNLTQLARRAKQIAYNFAQRKAYKDASDCKKVDMIIKQWSRRILEAKVRTRSSWRTMAHAPDILGWSSASLDRDKALKAWGAQRRRLGQSSSRAMHKFVTKLAETTSPLDFLYEASTRVLPREERVLLDALLALRPPETAPKLVQLANMWTSIYRLQLGACEDIFPVDFSPTARQMKARAALAWAAHVLHHRTLGVVANSEGVVAAALALLAEAEMDLLRTQHPELKSHYYVPAVVDGAVELFHECCSHKVKNCGQGVQGQVEPDDEDISMWPVKLKKIEDAADVPPVLVGLKGFCVNAFDVHSDAAYCAVFMSEKIKLRLIEQELFSEALVLDIIGEAQQAWVMQGLDQHERTIRLYHFSFMNYCIFGDKLFLPEPHKGNKTKIRGLVPNSLLAMHGNADGRHKLLKQHSDLADSFVEKCMSNVPDLENYFSELVKRCSFKPDCRTAEGVFKTIDAVVALKADVLREFWLVKSRKCKYDAADHAKNVVAVWNDGTKLDVRNALFKAYIDSLDLRLDKFCDPRVATVRERTKRTAT